jgi:hypothetical protein
MRYELGKIDKIETFNIDEVAETYEEQSSFPNDGKEYRRKNVATIIFQDGKFHKCLFSFSKSYSREEWRKLAALDKIIEKIEKDFYDKPKAKKK